MVRPPFCRQPYGRKIMCVVRGCEFGEWFPLDVEDDAPLKIFWTQHVKNILKHCLIVQTVTEIR
jgi:hypothetical protein